MRFTLDSGGFSIALQQVLLSGDPRTDDLSLGAVAGGDTLVVNAGAVSDQVDGDPRARWTLLRRRGGTWSAEFRAARYDVEAAVQWSRRHSPFGEFTADLLRSGLMRGRGEPSPE